MSLIKTTLEMRYNHIFPMPAVHSLCWLCNNNTECVGVDHMLIRILGMPLFISLRLYIKAQLWIGRTQ